MKRIGDRTLNRLVMFGKRTICKSCEWSKDASHPFRIHDERTHMVRRLRIRFEVGHVVADPFLLCFVPPDLPAFRVPRLARWIAGGAVVHDATICRPRPGPVLIDPES